MVSTRSSSLSPRKVRSRMSPRLLPIQVFSASPIPAKSLLPGKPRRPPQELWLWDQKGAPKQVSHFNDSWKQYSLSAPEFYKYKSKSPHGPQIEAALLKPLGYDGKSKLPLVALIHGGPTGAWQDSIETWWQLLAARGYAVFYPNIRGSSRYGEKINQMNR